MNILMIILLSLLLIFYFLVGIKCQVIELLKLPEPTFEFTESNGLHISFPVDEKRYQVVIFKGELECDKLKQNFRGSMKFQNNYWTYDKLNVPVCNKAEIEFSISALPEEKYNYFDDITSEGKLKVSHPKPAQSNHQSNNKPGLLDIGGGLTDTLGVQLNLFGVIKTNDGNSQNNDKENNNHIQIDQRIQTCIESKTKINGKFACQKDLIFEDNFDTFNHSKWQHEIKIGSDHFDAEYVTYQDGSENLYIKERNLIIKPTLLSESHGFNAGSIRNGNLDLAERCTGTSDSECRRKAIGSRILPPILSAKINTKKSFSFLYGKVEVRAKLPKGDWLFPQIFLEPRDNEYGNESYASGQLRVAFCRGNENLESKNREDISGYRLYGGIVLSTDSLLRDKWMKSTLKENRLGENYHIYTMTWSDESIVLEVDGTIYGVIRSNFKSIPEGSSLQYKNLWKNNMAPFDKEFYMSLGVSAGGIADFPEESLNGIGKNLKPWENTSPKGELRFWNDRNNWLPTWNNGNSEMKIDYIKIWAL